MDWHFGSLLNTMLALFMMATFDDGGAIYGPLIQRWQDVLGPFFLAFLLIVGIALMNLITAVIVECAVEQNKAERVYVNRKSMKKILPNLRALFCELDTD